MQGRLQAMEVDGGGADLGVPAQGDSGGAMGSGGPAFSAGGRGGSIVDHWQASVDQSSVFALNGRIVSPFPQVERMACVG